MVIQIQKRRNVKGERKEKVKKGEKDQVVKMVFQLMVNLRLPSEFQARYYRRAKNFKTMSILLTFFSRFNVERKLY